MELIKQNWTQKDIIEFNKYLKIFERPEKVEWTKNIVNTKMDVLAILSKDIKKITREIYKGNFLSFLDLNISDYYENLSINCSLISKIDDFEMQKKYLLNYSKKIDNWALCDGLKFNIKNNEENYYNLAVSLLKSELTFERRIGFVILFNYIDNDSYIDKIYEQMNNFYNEEEYYVNMINSWLLCELFIKRREKTIEYLKVNKLNKFTINKAISKCRDSYRISDKDKKMLLKYKK